MERIDQSWTQGETKTRTQEPAAMTPAVRDWVRCMTLADSLLGGDEGGFWCAYDERSEDVRRGMLDRFRLAGATLRPLAMDPGDDGLARLSFHFEDCQRHDQMEELWMRALSAEAPDEQAYLMNKCQQYALSEEPVYCLEGPRATLDVLVESVLAMEDGRTMLIGGDDGIVARCADRQDLPLGGEGSPSHDCWLVSRHGEVVLVDSTLLSSEVYVSRTALASALGQCQPPVA